MIIDCSPELNMVCEALCNDPMVEAAATNLLALVAHNLQDVYAEIPVFLHKDAQLYSENNAELTTLKMVETEFAKMVSDLATKELYCPKADKTLPMKHMAIKTDANLDLATLKTVQTGFAKMVSDLATKELNCPKAAKTLPMKHMAMCKTIK